MNQSEMNQTSGLLAWRYEIAFLINFIYICCIACGTASIVQHILHNKVLHVCAWWISLHLLPSPARTARCAHWSRKTWSWLTGLCFEFCVQVLMLSVFLLQEWESSTYPPWAHGPGYVFSTDIAKFVVEGHQKDILKVTYTYLACLFL